MIIKSRQISEEYEEKGIRVRRNYEKIEKSSLGWYFVIGIITIMILVNNPQIFKSIGFNNDNKGKTKIIYLDSPMQNIPNVTFYKDSSSDQISRSAQQLFDMGAKMRDQELKRHEIDSYSRALQNMDFGSSSRTTCTWVGNYLNCW